MVVLRYLGYGWLILATAVVANLLARSLGISTWYDYLAAVAETGPGPATAALTPGELAFLFVLYPGIFGCIVYIAASRG